MMRKKNEAITAVIAVTVIATVAVVAAVASFGYIIYDKFIKLKAVKYDPALDDDMFEESVDSLETMIVDDEDPDLF